MPIEKVSSEASGKTDLSAKLIVHWGRTFSTQKAKNRFFGSARKRLSFSTFLGKRLRSLRATAIQLHLPGDERYKNHAVAGGTEFESHKMKAFALFRYSDSADFLILLETPEQCAPWLPLSRGRDNCAWKDWP
jgi:hypothetical protein